MTTFLITIASEQYIWSLLCYRNQTQSLHSQAFYHQQKLLVPLPLAGSRTHNSRLYNIKYPITIELLWYCNWSNLHKSAVHTFHIAIDRALCSVLASMLEPAKVWPCIWDILQFPTLIWSWSNRSLTALSRVLALKANLGKNQNGVYFTCIVTSVAGSWEDWSFQQQHHQAPYLTQLPAM